VRIYSFEPLACPEGTLLILGSMPGSASLAEGEYYAHPRNAFWTIIDSVLGIRRELPYAERMQGLRAHGIALWDVLWTCERAGSLDADIVAGSMVANDFDAFFAAHPCIENIAFNGAAAERAFQRHVRPQLAPAQRAIPCTRLPSTSPANAGITLCGKIAIWRAFLCAERRVRRITLR
jgi:double-stranded uracil-DNA glycosylase